MWAHLYKTEQLEGLMLKLQYSGHLMWRADLLKNTLMLGKTEGRRSGWQDDMVGWHHWPNGLEFKQTPGDSQGQGSLVCCNPRGHKESDTTELLSNTHAWVEREDPGGWECMVFSSSFFFFFFWCEKKRKKSRWRSKQNQKRVPVFSLEKLEC